MIDLVPAQIEPGVIPNTLPAIPLAPGFILHIVGQEDATGSLPVGSECYVNTMNHDDYQFEGLHILEHRNTGKRQAKHIQVQYDGTVRAYSNDKGDGCKEFFIDITVPNPEWRSIGRVNWMFAKFY